MKNKFCLLPLLLLLPLCLSAAGKASVRYTAYIEQYAPLAIEQQQKHGIPASITLAQGLLESAAGQSTLATEGNNHFGIKCHTSWTGPTMLRDDDAPDECFRVYPDPIQSYEDHSLFLTRSRRYAPLFELPANDYAAWAHGLKTAGYATDPHYGERLIAIIEQYSLYRYDTPGLDDDQTSEFIMQQLRDTHCIRTSRGLYYIIAVPGDTYTSLARELGIPLASLMDYNDAAHTDPDTEIRPWLEIYLCPKLTNPPKKIKYAVIGQDETAYTVAQRYGIRMQTLLELNPDLIDQPGTRLRLK